MEKQRVAAIDLGVAFIDKIVSEYKDLDKDELMKMWECLLECPISNVVQRSSSKVVCSGRLKNGKTCTATASSNGLCGRHGGIKTPSSSPSRASPKVKNQCQGLTAKKEQCKKGATAGCNFCVAHKEKHTVQVEVVIEEPELVINEPDEVKVFELVFNKDDIVNVSLYDCVDERLQQYVHQQTSICVQEIDGEWFVIGYFNGEDVEDYDSNVHPKVSGIEILQL